jgi:DNA-directed RNA polymerase subunit F
MISKLIAIFIGAVALVIGILILIIKSKNKKIKEIDDENWELFNQLDSVESKNNILIEELKIEREHNDKLAKKLADISTMSIDDVLHELQNDKNS